METTAQYIEFAAECDRLAAEAQSERHRKILAEMAQRVQRARVRSRTCLPFPCIPEQTADIAQT
jgi:hypothetical protein